MTLPELVLFDLDGTLVDSEPLANRVFYEHLVAHGLPDHIDEAQVTRDLTGYSLPNCYKIVRSRYGMHLPEGFHNSLQAATFERLRAELRPIPGVPELLAGLKLPRCIASGSELEKIALSLQLTGLDHHFGPHFFSAEQVARGKPEPDLFLYAAERMGAAAPHRCLVVEDSLPGATAGHRAGMEVIVYRPHADADLEQPFRAMGCQIIRQMSELRARLNG